MMARRRAGVGGVTLLMLLVLAAGAGAWNYQQNLAAEQAVHRPFRGYTDVDLDTLSGALEARTKTQAEHYQVAASRRAAAGTKSYFDEQVAEFERVQRAGAVKRQAQRDLAGSRVTLKLLDEERLYRVRERERVKLFFERLLTI